MNLYGEPLYFSGKYTLTNILLSYYTFISESMNIHSNKDNIHVYSSFLHNFDEFLEIFSTRQRVFFDEGTKYRVHKFTDLIEFVNTTVHHIICMCVCVYCARYNFNLRTKSQFFRGEKSGLYRHVNTIIQKDQRWAHFPDQINICCSREHRIGIVKIKNASNTI